jgi:hypothetical protein
MEHVACSLDCVSEMVTARQAGLGRCVASSSTSSRRVTLRFRNQSGMWTGGRPCAFLDLDCRRKAAEYLRDVSRDRWSFCARSSGSSDATVVSSCSSAAALFESGLLASFWPIGVLFEPDGGCPVCARVRVV